MLFSFTKKVFRTFGKRIKNRFSRMGDNFSEDYVRYVLFTSLLRKQTTETAKNSLLIHMDLEYPYEKLLANNELEGKKLDMWVSNASSEIAIECKYHRKNKGGKNMASPMNAGKIFKDLCRLSKIKKKHKDKVDCYFVYVTTEIMATYLYKNYENFFELEESDSAKINKDFYSSLVSTCQKQIDEPFTCTITNVFADEFCKEESKIYIRIFEVDI